MDYMKYVILLIIFSSGCATYHTQEDVKSAYDSGSNHKALAIGSNNISGTAWNASTIDKAKQVALENCTRGRGIGCKIVSVNGVKVSNKKLFPVVTKPEPTVKPKQKITSTFNNRTTAIQNNNIPNVGIPKEVVNDKFYSFTVNTTPSYSTVKVMNITPRYRNGMYLKPGKYDILVKHKGYKQWRKWVEVVDSNLSIDVALKKAPKSKKLSKRKKKSKRSSGFGSCARKTCGQMTCKEAWYQYKNCGAKRRLDRNKDGIPCNKQCGR
ncbi:excalibur calcium-binding domain-containing protein [Candidatus Halobeggiatoa sp. HSG11]|nr:excalibur calcium-binding domain-containing protein [Candidatus Halobeggiatoa sp. HSG11]